MVFYFVSNTCMSWFNYYSVPWLNGNLALAEKCSGPWRFRLRQVLLYNFCHSSDFPTQCVFHYAQMSRMKLLWNGGGGSCYMELTSSSWKMSSYMIWLTCGMNHTEMFVSAVTYLLVYGSYLVRIPTEASAITWFFSVFTGSSMQIKHN
jgi:hypothetical protein